MSSFRLFVLPAAVFALATGCGGDPAPAGDDGRLQPQADGPAVDLPVDDLTPDEEAPPLEEDPNPAADKPPHHDDVPEEDPVDEHDDPPTSPPPPGSPPPPPPPGAPPPPATTCADEDAFEPNDAQTQARVVSIGSAVDAFACPADPDWFAVDVQSGCSITVTTTFVNDDGDLDIALYGPDGVEVASSAGVADDETVTWDAVTTGKYAVEVMPYGDAQNAFTLTTTVDCGGVTPPPAPTGTCTNDADADTTASAATITTSAAGVSGIACSTDKDWFKLDVQAGCTVRGSLALTNADGDIDLVLEDAIGTRLSSSTTYDDVEEVEAVFAAAGQARFGVFGYGTADNDYRLTVSLDCPVAAPALACPADDEWEPNDDAYWALSIFDDETLHGIVCSNDQDVWALQVQDTCAAVIELDFAHAAGDLDMSFHTPNGSLMDSSTGSTNRERIVEVANETGEHFIRVAGYNGAQNEYDVSVTTVCREDFSCPNDDPYEPNDARSAAVHLDAFDRSIGMTCGDDDWYYVDAQPGCMVYADLSFSDAEGDLDLEIVDGANTVVGESSGTGDLESADAYVYVAGKIALRVVPYNGAQARYLLETQVYCP